MEELEANPQGNASDDDLPDVLEKGYILLRYSILHPKMLIGFRLIIVMLIGAAYLVPLFVPIIFSVHEIMIDGSMTNVMENLQLPAGYTQVSTKFFRI